MKNADNQSQKPDPRKTEIARKNKRLVLILFTIVASMGALSYAAVPLYAVFCRVTGYGGTTQVSSQLPSIILERRVTIQFNADTNRNLPWIFKPEARAIEVQLGQRGLTAFTAENTTAKPTAGMALYNVTPLKAGKYFHKIQCFCFDEQILGAHEKATMPVLFYVDPAMDEDPDMKDVHTITLSYSFFKTESESLDQALEAFYNDEIQGNAPTKHPEE